MNCSTVEGSGIEIGFIILTVVGTEVVVAVAKLNVSQISVKIKEKFNYICTCLNLIQTYHFLHFQ